MGVGRATSETGFLAEAVQRYAESLELDENEIRTAADEGIADMEAGRFEPIFDCADMKRLQAQLGATLHALAKQSRSASR